MCVTQNSPFSNSRWTSTHDGRRIIERAPQVRAIWRNPAVLLNATTKERKSSSSRHRHPNPSVGELHKQSAIDSNTCPGLRERGLRRPLTHMFPSWRWGCPPRKVCIIRTRAISQCGDAGSRYGCRSRLWKLCIQQLADGLGIKISVCHFLLGTSKSNKIEHRMICHISENWRAQPWVSQADIVVLIANPTTEAGRSIKAQFDKNTHELCMKIKNEELTPENIMKDKSRGDWN